MSESYIEKSTDAGIHWDPLVIDKANLGATSLVVDPSDRNHLYLGTGSGVFGSGDGGHAWVPSGLSAEVINTLLLTGGAPGLLLAGTSLHGVYRSPDGGATWVAANDGIPVYYNGISVQSLAAGVNPAGEILAGLRFGGGVFRSLDGGLTWTPVNDGLPAGPGYIRSVTSLAADPLRIHTFHAGLDQAGVWQITFSNEFDVNRDGVADALDVLCLVGNLAEIVGIPSLDPYDSDFDGDSRLSAVDLAFLQNGIVGNTRE